MSSESSSSPITFFKSVGPAIIVAAVVLGPGSIIVSSKVGAIFGYSAVWVLVLAIILLIGMVRLAAHVGLAYEKTPCQEIADRLGKKTAAALGVILFLIIACFQTSNNIAVATAIEPLFGSGIPEWAPAAAIICINVAVLLILYLLPSLYKRVESIMKVLVLLMILAFLTNAVAALPSIIETLKGILPIPPKPDPNLGLERFKDLDEMKGLADPYVVIGALIATTFSVAAAFYQAYLVRERGWSLGDSENVRKDASFGIIVLGAISLLIMMTSAAVFYGELTDIEPPVVTAKGEVIDKMPAAASLKGATDVAGQLAPLFGSWAKVIFGLGIFAAAISSFLVNAMIGGTILSDGLGRGAKMQESWPRHLTALALIVGMLAGLLSVTTEFSHTAMITFAQALTVLGVPALAAALIYLGTRPELTGERRLPPKILAVAYLGAGVAVLLAFRTAAIVIAKLLS